MNGIEEPAREVGIEFGTYAGWKLVAFLANVHIPRNEYESRVTKITSSVWGFSKRGAHSVILTEPGLLSSQVDFSAPPRHLFALSKGAKMSVRTQIFDFISPQFASCSTSCRGLFRGGDIPRTKILSHLARWAVRRERRQLCDQSFNFLAQTKIRCRSRMVCTSSHFR